MHTIRIDLFAALLIIFRHGMAGDGQAARIRLVSQSRGLSERMQNLLSGILKSGVGRIGFGEIENFYALPAFSFQQLAQAVGLQIPFNPGGERDLFWHSFLHR